jgi:hypothetical protein
MMTWQTKIIAILLVLTSLFVLHKYEVSKAVTKTIIEQTAVHEKQVKELTIKSLKVESELKTQVAVIKEEKDAQIKSIDSKYRAIISSLRQRQERVTSTNSTGSSNNAESAKWTTGAGLYKEDAEFLAGFARDTEELKVYLNSCYVQYDVLREQLNNYRK